MYKLRAPKRIIEFVRELRQEQTPAEELLWQRVRGRKLGGLKINRQFPIVVPQYMHSSNYFVADFYCHEKKLVIELDGEIHLTKRISERDENRTAELKKLGLRVLRIANEEVLKDIDNVLKKILEF